MTTITCVITSFNNMPYISEALDSLLTQTRPLDEIIIADDGSTDGSRDMLESLENEHKNIRLIFRERNLGVAANRDLAIRDASSVFVTTLDADDIYYPDKVSKEVELLDGAVDKVAFSDVDWINKEGSVIQKLVHTHFSSLPRPDQTHYLLFRRARYPGHDVLKTVIRGSWRFSPRTGSL